MKAEHPAQTLRRLQTDYPQLTITTEFCGQTRIWMARGEHGYHPWLVLSSDLTRCRVALGPPPTS